MRTKKGQNSTFAVLSSPESESASGSSVGEQTIPAEQRKRESPMAEASMMSRSSKHRLQPVRLGRNALGCRLVRSISDSNA